MSISCGAMGAYKYKNPSFIFLGVSNVQLHLLACGQ